MVMASTRDTQNMYVMIKQMFDYVFIRYSTRA